MPIETFRFKQSDLIPNETISASLLIDRSRSSGKNISFEAKLYSPGRIDEFLFDHLVVVKLKFERMVVFPTGTAIDFVTTDEHEEQQRSLPIRIHTARVDTRFFESSLTPPGVDRNLDLVLKFDRDVLKRFKKKSV